MALSAVAMVLVIMGAILIYFTCLEVRVSILGVILLVIGILGIALLGVHSIRDAKESAQKINHEVMA
jgi:Tfp pilus assembly protein PilV